MYSLCKEIRFCYIFVVLSLVGCLSPEISDIVEKSGYYYIKPRPAYINDVEVVDWHVGVLGKTTISKGILVKSYLPKIPKKTLHKFISDYKINAWVVRIRKRSSGITRTLQSFYVPIINETSLVIKRNSSYRINQREMFVARVYYVDASMSGRFEKLTCPALGHNLVLKDVELLKRKSFDRFITVKSKTGSPFNRKVAKYQISENKINGGKSLKGEYSIEVALYDFKRKRVFSNFYDLANIVKISVERSISIRGCTNFKVPPKKNDREIGPSRGIFQ